MILSRKVVFEVEEMAILQTSVRVRQSNALSCSVVAIRIDTCVSCHK